jgi:hydrogenase maturation protease
MGAAGSSGTMLIVGVGNELLGDEGLGVHVARSLLQRSPPLPPHVEVVDAGTALLDVLPEMARHSRVVIVDAIRTGKEPGTLYRAEVDSSFLGNTDSVLPLSLHQWDLLETLRVGQTLGLLPAQLTVLGAEPENISPGTRLSHRLAQAAENIVAGLLTEIFSINHAAAPGENLQRQPRLPRENL